MCSHFSLQKQGNSLDEYEDAFCPKLTGIVEADSFSYAVADGATESSFSCEWAKMITRGFIKSPTIDADNFKEIIVNNGSRWWKIINSRNLSWHAAEKIKDGAFATFIGVIINIINEKIVLSSIAVGDSCLFHFRDYKLLKAFPIETSLEFNSTPYLISSKMARNTKAFENIKIMNGMALEKDDYVFIATDALSHWILSSHEEQSDGYLPIFDLGTDFGSSQENFSNLINDLRLKKLMRNDDVTLLIIRVT